MKINTLMAFALLTILTTSCSQKTSDKNNNKVSTVIAEVGNFELKNDLSGKTFPRGEKINLEWVEKYDSVTIYTNGIRNDVVGSNNFDLSSSINKTGRFSLRITGWLNSKKFITRKTFDVVSSTVPTQYKVTVLNKYWHNPNSFIQGLFYRDGFLYEGTGQFGESKLLKNDISTGKSVSAIDIERDQFGEGITFFNDKIYQITWVSQKVHIYNYKTLEKIRTLSYPYAQGWGITTMDNNLILSDGTATLTIVDPNDFSQIDAIQVFDDKGPIDSLNELEYVDGILYANVWQKPIIIMIDISTGEVIGTIDCTELSNKNNSDNNDNVLNGIAYNSKTKHFYITGKRWENLYEVTFQKK